jgi:hypothetical protein
VAQRQLACLQSWGDVMRVLTLALLFAATSAMADTPPPPVPAPGAPPQAPPASIWKPVQDGGLEHLQSGLSCPGKTGRFTRTEAHAFDDFGLDVGCNYVSPETEITVYLTRRTTGDLPAAMTEAKRELLQYGESKHPKALGDSQPTLGGLVWSKALYGEDGDRHSSIWITDLSGWTLEYRATYPIADEARTEADIAAINGLVRASAGERLSLCLKSPSPVRSGVRVVDKQELEKQAMMSSILGGAAMAAVQDQKAQAVKAPQPIVSCVEQSVRRNGHPLLFWRGVDPSGADAQADKISLVTSGPPPTIDISADHLANLISAVNDAGGATRWTASNEHGGKVTIFGYFNGRPSADAAADLFDDVVTGRTKAIGGYSVDGKKINIIMPTDK